MSKTVTRKNTAEDQLDFVNLKELDKKLILQVPFVMEYTYQKKIYDFFVENSKERSVSVGEMYDKLYPNFSVPYNGGMEYYAIDRFITRLEQKGVLLQSNVVYKGVHRIGYIVNPDLQMPSEATQAIKSAKKE